MFTYTNEELASEMLPSLDSFVSYDTDVFKSRPDYRQKVLGIYLTRMSSEQLRVTNRVNGCKLEKWILLSLRGHVDDVGI